MMLNLFQKPKFFQTSQSSLTKEAQLVEILENFNTLTAALVDTVKNHEKRIAHLENMIYGDNVSDTSESNS